MFLFFSSDSKVLLCDFHRQQAWLRWLSSTNNGKRERIQRSLFIIIIRNIAASETFEEYTTAHEGARNMVIAKTFWILRLGKTWFQLYEVCYLPTCQPKEASASNTQHF